MREDAQRSSRGVGQNPIRSTSRQFSIGRFVFFGDPIRFGQDFLDATSDHRPHTVHTPGEVDRCRSCIADPNDLRFETGGIPVLAFTLQHRDGHSVPTHGTQRRGATHDEPDDGVDHIVHSAARDVRFRRRQLGLIDQDQGSVRPLDRTNVTHKISN